MQITVEITAEMQAQIETIAETRTNRTIEALLTQIVERGIYALAYRTRYNRERYENERADRDAYKAFKASLKA